MNLTVWRVLLVVGGCVLLYFAVSSYIADGEGSWGRGLALTFGPLMIAFGLWSLFDPRRPLRSPHLSPVRAQWTVREPANRSDSVPHEEYVFARREGPWRLLAASVRGKYHAHAALWRDDAFAWAMAGPWTVLAVADGAGSAPLSRVAAAVACAEGVRALEEKTAGVPPGPDAAEHLRAALAVSMLRAREAVRSEAEKRRRPEREFQTTCLLVVHATVPAGDVVGALQVGDGAIGLYHDDGTCLVLGAADHGAYASETRFLTTPGIDEGLKGRAVVTVRSGLRAVAVMTDGVADDFFPEKTRLVQLFGANAVNGLTTPQGEPLPGILRGPTHDPLEGQALAEWLRYEKRGSSDDRTLVLLYRAKGDAE
jgi:hypothetical protein